MRDIWRVKARFRGLKGRLDVGRQKGRSFFVIQGLRDGFRGHAGRLGLDAIIIYGCRHIWIAKRGCAVTGNLQVEAGLCGIQNAFISNSAELGVNQWRASSILSTSTVRTLGDGSEDGVPRQPEHTHAADTRHDCHNFACEGRKP